MNMTSFQDTKFNASTPNKVGNVFLNGQQLENVSLSRMKMTKKPNDFGPTNGGKFTPGGPHHSMEELCSNFSKLLAESKTAEALVENYCFVLMQLFGANSRMNLFWSNGINGVYDNDALFSMLRSGGPVLKSADSLLRGLLTTLHVTIDRGSCNISDIKPSHWSIAGVALSHPSDDLHLSGLSSYEAYFFLFFWHASKANVNSFGEQWERSVYCTLLDEYLSNFLDSKAQFFNWPLADSCRKFFKNSPAFNTSPVSPYGLLSTKFYASDEERQGDMGARSAQNELSWKASVFFNLLCDVWMSSLNEVRGSGAVLARPAFDLNVIAILVQHVLGKIYSSAFGNLSTVTTMVESLSRTEPFERAMVDRIFNFIRVVFQTWPTDGSFKHLFALWLTAIQPWCHGADNLERYSNRWKSFVIKNRDMYKQLFLLTLRHFSNFKMTNPTQVTMLSQLCAVYDQQELIDTLKEHEAHLLMQSSACSAPEAGEQFFFSELVQLTARTLLLGLIRAKRTFEAQLQSSRIARQGRSWWQAFVDLFDVQLEADEYAARQLLNKLKYCERTLSDLFQMDLYELEKLVDDQMTSLSTFNDMPDSFVDQSNRLRLSHLGQCQVLGRVRHYPVEQYPVAPYDQLPLRSNESALLYRMQSSLSQWLNEHFAQHFDNAYNDSGLLGYFARRVLLAPSAQTMHHTPIMGRPQRELPARISLRRFASPRFTCFTLALAFLLCPAGMWHMLDMHIALYLSVIFTSIILICRI